jgi:rhodanese-related sulfurtransferase
MCGKNLSKETSSTIGQQRKLNYALQPMSKEQFVKMMTTDLPEAPAYFSKDAEINRSGAAALNGLPQPAALLPTEVRELAGQGHVVLDVRAATDFGAGHVPGALNIGLGGQFASWAGSLIPITAAIVIVADSEEQVEEAQLRLARVGIEGIKGYLSGGILGWSQADLEVAAMPQITVSELNDLIPSESGLQVIDVRRPAEYEGGHVPRAVTAPLSALRENLSGLGLDRAKPTAVICAGGYRSSAAASIMQQAGFTNLMNVTGGTSAWINAGYAVEIPG